MDFCKLDLNDKYLEFCVSICCSQNHHIIMNPVFFPHGEMDMNFADVLNVTCRKESQFAIFVKNVLTVKDLMG